MKGTSSPVCRVFSFLVKNHVQPLQSAMFGGFMRVSLRNLMSALTPWESHNFARGVAFLSAVDPG